VTLQVADLDDRDLASLASGGNHVASTELVRRHRDWVYRLIRSQIGDPDESLDVTQASFVAAFGALERFDRARPFKHWLARIALNKCKDWKRRALAGPFSAAAPLAEVENVADQTPGVEAVSADKSELRRTLRAISELPTSLRSRSCSARLTNIRRPTQPKFWGSLKRL
jgi:RNA polymerase sigma-70 factor (ECF subfamily)